MNWTGTSSPAERPDAGLLLPDWPAPAGVRAFVTLRSGGFSRGAWGLADGAAGGWNLATHCGDDADAVRRNRERLRTLLPAEPRWLEQVHGTAVHDADPGALAPRRMGAGAHATGAVPAADDDRPGLPCADAAVTARRGVVLAVLTADCLPVLLSNRSGSVVGIAHAGWRGLAAGVLERTLDALAARAADRDWIAWLGPAIGPASFEVGEEVREAFVAADAAASDAFTAGRAAGKWQADLFMLARQRLASAGVASIHGGGECTVSDAARFYSYRRDRVTGRMASLIWLA